MAKLTASLFKGFQFGELALCTPATRDRFVDFLRAYSISTVVFGHWLSTMVIRHAGGFRVVNVVGMIPGLWVVTWVLQVMPLFFFVGGFSNFVTLDAFKRRGEPIRTFYRARALRLLKPTAVLLGVWFVILVVPSFFSRSFRNFALNSYMIFGPLWFLAVYLIVIMASPGMRTLHRRFGIIVPVVLVVLAGVVDVISFRLKIPGLRWVNPVLVWFFVHQFGFFYADGTLLRIPRWTYLLMALVGLGGLTLLTTVGGYPKSMVGTGLEKFSNMHPPTICIVFLTIWLVGLAMVVREPLSRWLKGIKPWTAVIAANTVIMTVFLWHLAAWGLAYLLLYPLGFGRHTGSTASFWLERPLWIVVPGIILAIFVLIFGRFERPGRIERARV